MSIKKFGKDPSYYKPIPSPHPAIEKYNFTMEDVHREGMNHGIAPPTLFGILIGRIKSNGFIDSRMERFIDPEDVRALKEDYDPLRHYQFFDEDESKGLYTVNQRYPAGMCKKGDCLHTDDDRWIIISDIEKTNSTCRIFSGGALVATVSKSTLLTVAVAAREKNPYVGKKLKKVGKKKPYPTVKFFERDHPDDFDYNDLYQTIYDSL